MNWKVTAAASIAFFAHSSLNAIPPYSGGETTIELFGSAENYKNESFSQPAPNLSLTRRNQFFIGNSFFRNPWVTAPASTSARDGLGPVFSSQSCQSCHVKDGRGRPPQPGEELLSMLLRISLAEGTQDKTTGAIEHPVYGDQIQNRAIPGVSPEATPGLTWIEETGMYPDGTSFTLRRPHYELKNPQYGDLPPDLRISGRIATQMSGVGLLDTISEETLQELADPEDQDGDGVSGKMNWVWDAEKKGKSPGRFGWKAEQPNVRQQTASAFLGDIGITSSLFPKTAFTKAQRQKASPPHGGEPEVDDEILESVVFYSKLLAVPAQRNHDQPFIVAGKKHFTEIGCATCHVETLQTGNDPNYPELSNQEIHPYTDLLLHDMGEGLADHRPVFEATGKEWRTAPLWGLGLVKMMNLQNTFLHDGRARTIEEAILWHCGEAEGAKSRFMNLPREERHKILAFLNSL